MFCGIHINVKLHVTSAEGSCVNQQLHAWTLINNWQQMNIIEA